MAKNKKTNKEYITTKPEVQYKPLTTQRKKWCAIGAALVLLGFIILTRADSMGKNWAATSSPFIILGGYLVIGLGLIYPFQAEESSKTPQ